MNKEQIIYKYLDSQDVLATQRLKQYHPRATKNIGLSDRISYGIELEFPYNTKDEDNLIFNFNIYNKKMLNNNWQFSKEHNSEYPSNISIGEFTSPILHDDISSLDQLNIIVQLISKFENKVLKASCRNMHFHFDMNLLGESLEHLKSFLEIFRAYENIIFRISTSETGRVPKSGISNRIQEALKSNDIHSILKTYNGGEYNLDNLLTYRKLPVNLFNIGAYFEANNTTPGVVYTKSDNMLQEVISSRLTLDINSPNKRNERISKILTPTLELRLTPTTHDLGYLQQFLILDTTIIDMARNIEIVPGLREKVNNRNTLIDKYGPQIFDVEFDDGIDDILSCLPRTLSKRILLSYLCSKQLNLYVSDQNR